VVCPASNDAYLKLEPAHAPIFGEGADVAAAMKKLLRRDDVFAVTNQATLAAAVRASNAQVPEGWSEYLRDRYGW